MFFSFCGSNNENESTKTDKIHKEKVNIYHTIIDTVEQNVRKGGSSRNQIAILDSTETFRFNKYSTTPDSASFMQKLANLNSSTFINFLDQNREKKSLNSLLDLDK